MATDYVSILESAYPVIRQEALSLREQDWLRWPAEEAYTGNWSIFPFLTTEELGIPEQPVEANRRRCPRTIDVLRQLDRLMLAGFSRMDGGSRTVEHREELWSARERCHLALKIPAGAYFQLDGRRVDWQEGRCLVFNAHRVHRAVHEGSEPRVLLICDFDVTKRAADDPLVESA